MRKILLFLTASISILILSSSFALAKNYMSTESYDVKAKLSSSYEIDIVETIKVNFNEERHGIYRYIPYSGTMYYVDPNGKEVEMPYEMKIKNINVEGDYFQVADESSKKVIRIGDENDYVTGKKTYVISYTAVVFANRNSDYDIFYYNFLPTDWETPINKASVSLNMPKKFDSNEVEVYIAKAGGNKGKVGSKEVWVDGKNIKIEGLELGKGVGITLKTLLPDGYFTGQSSFLWINFLAAIIAALIVLLLILLWIKFGRGKKHVQTVEFNPPEGMSPAEVGYIIDGTADKEDIISCFIYFAQKGYVKIKEEEKLNKKGKSKGTKFIIEKQTELPDDAKTYERTIFGALFKEGLRDSVDLSDLDDDFGSKFEAARDMLSAEFTSNPSKRIFSSISMVLKYFAIFTPLLLLAIIGLLLWIIVGSDNAILAILPSIPLVGGIWISNM
ncbi:MAG: DUF2207 domain-containing protein, partial [Anaerovoracaceae bacterium]